MKTRIRDIGKLNYLVDRKVADPNWEGYGNQTHTDARKAVYKEILEGFRSLEEAAEYIRGQPEDNVIFTARGDEILFSMINVVIDHIKKNKWYSPWGKTAFTDSVKHGIKMVEILLTPKQVDIVFNRFIDVGYDWVKFSPPVDRMKATPRRVSLLIPRHRVNEALSILESAIDITRDWVSDPTGRAEHKSTVNLYDRVKSASTDSVKSVPMTPKGESRFERSRRMKAYWRTKEGQARAKHLGRYFEDSWTRCERCGGFLDVQGICKKCVRS